MSQPIHTFGRGCDFAPPSSSSSEKAYKPCDEMPPMRAQFFYCSPLPLDDPLTAVPPPTADSKNIKHPPLPFPRCDNKALLEAWLGMGSRRDRRSHNRTCRPKSGVEPAGDKKFGVIGMRPKIKQEVKGIKESLSPTTANAETYQPTTGSATHQQPAESETTHYQQEHIAGGMRVKSALEMTGCPCKGSHLWCRKKSGRCKCTSCPKAPQDVVAETQTYQPQIFPQQTKGEQPTSSTDPITELRSKEEEMPCKDSKPEESPEPECSCNQPLQDSDGKIGRSEEPQPKHSRPTEPLPASKQKKGEPEEVQQDNFQSECLCTEEDPKQASVDQTKRSKHWEHNCRKGRSERGRSEKKDKQEENTSILLPKETKHVTRKSKHKGKSVAVDDEDEAAQTEETKAWFDQQLRAQLAPIPDSQMETTSVPFHRDQGHKTEDTEDSENDKDEEDTCCATFNNGEKKDDLTSPASRVQSCCDNSKGDNFYERQKSEAETIFSGSCDKSKVDSSFNRKQSESESIFSGSCDKNKVDQRKESEVETVFSDSCDKSKIDERKESEVETVFSGSCDKSKVDERKESDTDTVFSGSCNKRNVDPSKETEIPEKEALEKQVRERSAALKTSFQKISDKCCTDLEQCAATIVYEAMHKNCQPQNSSGQSVQKHSANDNQFEHSARSSAHKSHSHHHHTQHATDSSVPKSTSHDNHIQHSIRPPAHKSYSHYQQVPHFTGSHKLTNKSKCKSNDNQFEEYSGLSEVHPCVEPKVEATNKNSKGKGRFFGRRQADGTADQDGGLYDDSDEDVPADHTITDQGDATNDKCTCEPHLQTSETNVPVARTGNAYTKSGQTTGSGTTGKPFVKLPARGEDSAHQHGPEYDDEPFADPQKSHERDPTEDMEVEGCKAYKHKQHTKCQVDVPVGTCRLHFVSLPSLVMKPIYWSPLNDQYPCIYGTWFYKDTMCPVEPAVANQLEKGYRENECWTQTWDDQLNSAVEVGPEGEEKIVHRLWPEEKDTKSSAYDASEHILSTDPYCAARCFYGEAAAEGKVEESEAKPVAATSISKKYPNSQVIYKNCEEAFILKPNLCPSAYYGRRPLTKIKNGTGVGVAVVRGFDRKVWNKLYPSKKLTAVTKTQSKNAKHNNSASISDACPACKIQDEHEKVSDLCLVVHGIGQKLSERMESFNFTYAVNSFRCEMKRELINDDVKKVLREDFSGVMVLPVNWRANLSFEDGGPRKPGDKDRIGCDYSLNDITQPTIPRVRELISDVMLDIPYYMSGHKDKMIAALISEANRIYRLWCKNNPGFHKSGRVHLVSHSLGSVMSLEVLSKQPTTLPAELSWRPNNKYFEFQTTNCFLAGSPCAFFLLLESKGLVPRKGIYKSGCESENGSTKDIYGDAGTFGCLAVDNLYNIMHCNDPIAYRLNACVDSKYAAGLKQAEVPDSSRSFMTAVSHAMKSAAGISQNEETPMGEMPRPTTITKMPSQMEMEVHDFTAEEMAERKFCQLNENGQIDWILGNRPGMLANQYIDMLSAHSSYWNNKDFMRFLCVEMGRREGKMNTMPNMRARKKSQK